MKCILCHLWVEIFHRCTKLFMVLLTGSYQNILAHTTHVAGIHMHMYLQPLGALRHDYCYCTETFIQHISCAICMNPICQTFIKLILFMMSCFGHANICLAGEEKYVAKNIAKPGRLLHRSRISTVITANPWTNSKGIQKLRAVHTGDKSLSHTDPETEPFSETNHVGSFKPSSLTSPARSWMVLGCLSRQKCWLHIWNTSGLAHFYQPQYSHTGFWGHSTQLEKQTKTILPPTLKALPP